WLILMGWAVMYVDMTSSAIKRRMYVVSVIEMTLVIALLVCPRLLKWAEGLTLHPDFDSLTVQERRKFFLRTWLYVFLAFLVFYIVFYPGCFNADNVDQYRQAVRGAYADHHPVSHTLFSFTLPLKLTGGWPGSIVLFQIIIFSFSLSYTVYTLYEYGSFAFARCFLLFTLLNPITHAFCISPLKDVTFAIASMLMMTFAVRVHFTGGEWMKGASHTVIFVLVAVAGTLFRHNAILFTLPLFLAMFFCADWKKVLAMLLCFAGLIYAVRGPMYDALKVGRADGNRQIEACGLPLTIIGNAVKEAPERLDNEILEFAYTIAHKDIWEKHFNVFRGWDDMKFLAGRARENNRQALHFLDLSDEDFQVAKKMDIQAVERVGWKKIVLMALRCFKEAPYEALRGALGITATNYAILGKIPSFNSLLGSPEEPDLSRNEFFRLDFLTGLFNKILPSGLNISFQKVLSGDISLQSILALAEIGIAILLKPFSLLVGFINLAIIIFILARLKFNRAYDWKRLCLVLPLLIHNFGTMLLLMGPVFRYFYVSYLVFPLIILVLMRGKESN
ncbi:MAG: hypothetical protein IJQ58_04430, partial [Synergistaceae bacterium]|nr:hypothetical protein [Synergistaceae bacterium]